MSMLSNLDLIRRVPLFSMLTDRQAQTVADAVVKRRFRRNACIVEHGQKTDALYIIMVGKARVSTSDRRGREVILANLSMGDCIGEMSLIDNKPHSATVTCETPVDTLVLGRADFMACMPDTRSLAHAVMVGLVKRLRRADSRIESLALFDVYGRVARALVENAETGADGTLFIRGRVSRQGIAKMVGASREMVSRVMKEFELAGFVVVDEQGNTVIRERRDAFAN